MIVLERQNTTIKSWPGDKSTFTAMVDAIALVGTNDPALRIIQVNEAGTLALMWLPCGDDEELHWLILRDDD